MEKSKSFLVNKCIFFLINMAIMWSVLAKDGLSDVVTACMIVLEFLILAVALYKSDYETPASGYLMEFVALDMALYLTFSGNELGINFFTDVTGYIKRSAGTKWLLWVFLFVSIIAAILACLKADFICLGVAEAISLVIVLNPWNSLRDISWEASQYMVLGGCLVMVGIWSVLLRTAMAAAPQRKKRELLLGGLVFFVMLFLVAVKSMFVENMVEQATAVFDEFLYGGSAYTWGQVVVTGIILLLCVLLMYDQEEQEGRLGVDAFLAAAGIPFIFAMKICQGSNNASYYWSLAFLLAGLFWCLIYAEKIKEIFLLLSPVFLFALHLSIFAIRRGFFWNVVGLVIIMTVGLFCCREKDKGKNSLWMLAVTGILFEALAYRWEIGYLENEFWLIALVWIMAIVILGITAFLHPEKKDLPVPWGLCIVAGCVVLAALMIVARPGAVDLLPVYSMAFPGK